MAIQIAAQENEHTYVPSEHPKYSVCITSFNSYSHPRSRIIPIAHVTKPRLKEVIEVSLGHTAKTEPGFKFEPVILVLCP